MCCSDESSIDLQDQNKIRAPKVNNSPLLFLTIPQILLEEGQGILSGFTEGPVRAYNFCAIDSSVPGEAMPQRSFTAVGVSFQPGMVDRAKAQSMWN